MLSNQKRKRNSLESRFCSGNYHGFCHSATVTLDYVLQLSRKFQEKITLCLHPGVSLERVIGSQKNKRLSSVNRSCVSREEVFGP